MFNSTKKKKAQGTKKAEGYRDDNLFPARGPPPVDDILSAPPPPAVDETESILMHLHTALIEFYTKHKPENLDEDVLTILMQFYIDSGGDALNKKLKAKYGEDLLTFKPVYDEPVPPPPVYQKSMERVRARRSEKDLLEQKLPPPPKDVPRYDPKPPPVPRKVANSSSAKSDDMDSDLEDLDDDVAKDLEKEDPSLRLEILDTPADTAISPRDLIEAFYAKYDEKKLETDTGIEKFVMWVEQHSLDGLNEKLKEKYGEGLFDVRKQALRRRNLEDRLTEFYCEHDMAKLETRWTIMKIINWTMAHGLVALNKKFMTRYGIPVIKL